MAIFTAIATLVGSAIAGISAALSAITATALGSTLLQLGLGAALSFGASLLAPRSRPKFANPAPQYQAVLNQAAAPRRRLYGRGKLGGTRAFFDSKGGSLYQIVTLAQGPLTIRQMYVGDEAVSVWPSGTTLGDGTYLPPGTINGGTIGSYGRLFPFAGGVDQPSSAEMRGDWPEVWTTAHRLRGIAYILAIWRSPPSERYLAVFPEGFNTAVRAECDGAAVLDVRTGLTAWTDNPALILRDYLTHPDGYRRLTAADIDETSFAAMANICDELVPRAVGDAEKRYRAWGAYELNDDPTEVIRRILSTCDGELYTTREGKVAIRGGRWTEPAVTITGDHILGYDVEEGADALDRFNQLKILYTDPVQDYQPTEATPWDDLADQAERGVVTQDFSVDMCPSPSQARRLAKILIAKSNPRWRGTIRTDLYGLLARGERIVRVVIPELQIDTTFLVTSHNLTVDQGMPVGCEIGILALDASAYAWTTAEEGTNPAAPQDTAPDTALPVPTVLSLRTESRSGSVVALATVATPPREDAQLEAQIRLASSTIWESMSVATGSLEAVSGALTSAAVYSVRARFRTAGASGDWAVEETITASINTTPPGAPTSFTATLDGTEVDLAWVNPSPAPYRTRIYRAAGASAVFADAVLVEEAEGTTYTDAPGSGDWRYWIAGRTVSATQGATAGPRTVTVP